MNTSDAVEWEERYVIAILRRAHIQTASRFRIRPPSFPPAYCAALGKKVQFRLVLNMDFSSLPAAAGRGLMEKKYSITRRKYVFVPSLLDLCHRGFFAARTGRPRPIADDHQLMRKSDLDRKNDPAL